MSARTHPAIAVPIDRGAIAMSESTPRLLITSDVLVAPHDIIVDSHWDWLFQLRSIANSAEHDRDNFA